jgi:putative exosortase-associated protein (TIGR04073 family)
MIALLCASSASVAADDYLHGVGDKLAAGSSNLVLGWLEIPKNMINTSNEYNIALGLTGGLVKGALHTIGRTVSGLFDVVTFPLPSTSIVQPPYVWENFDVETKYGPIPF